MSAPIPERIERLICEAEEKLTAELREATGRDDITAHFDREPIKITPDEGWPAPAPLPPDYWETAE